MVHANHLIIQIKVQTNPAKTGSKTEARKKINN